VAVGVGASVIGGGRKTAATAVEVVLQCVCVEKTNLIDI